MINIKRLDNLIKHKVFPAASIMIPTNIVGDYEVNRIRWKNELSDVYKKLEAQGYEKKSFLKPADALLENTDFWARQSAGLAGYFSEGFNQIVHLIKPIEPQNYLSNTFVTTPILLSQINKRRVFLLTLSQSTVRFFEAVNSGIFPIKINDLVPENMKKALNLDIEKETLHSAGQGLSSTNHHKDNFETRLKQYFKKIDEGLWTLLQGETVPLVIAGVDEYHSLYKSVSRYQHISAHRLQGNVDNMLPSELRLQLDPVFADIYEKEQKELDNTLKNDYDREKLIQDRETLQFNLEIDNVARLIIPDRYALKHETQILGLENILRNCYHRNIPVKQISGYDNMVAVSRNNIVQPFN